MRNVVLQDGRYLPQVEKERWRTCFIAGAPMRTCSFCWLPLLGSNRKEKKIDTLIKSHHVVMLRQVSLVPRGAAHSRCDTGYVAVRPRVALPDCAEGYRRFERNKGKKTKSRPPIGDLLFVGSPCWARTERRKNRHPD